MAIYSYDPHTRYKKRFIHRLMSGLLFLGLIAVCVACGFWLGRLQSEQRIKLAQDQLALLTSQKEGLEEMLLQVRTEAQTAMMRYQQLQGQVEEQIPEGGPMEALVGLLRQQLDEGMDPQKLTFAIRSAQPPRNCSEPETLRFVIKTPVYTGPDSFVQVADGGLTIRGEGASARNDKGESEAWYDSSKAVSIRFQNADGQTETKTGVMPLHHSVVIGAREYRLTIEEGSRSFAKVTFDSCDYP